MRKRTNAAMVIGLSAATLAMAPTAHAIDSAGKLNADLSGTAGPGPGDPDGSGTAEVTIGTGAANVCYAVAVKDIGAATMMHIHRGEAGADGPPVVTLDPPAKGSSSGCAEVAADIAAEIGANPASFYVNVHNAEFPAGAIRGQLGS